MSVPEVMAGALLGLMTGAAYFALLFRSVRFAEDPSPRRVVALLLLRGALAVAVFAGLARLGALPLIAGLAGFLIARHLIRRLVVEAG